MDAPPALAGVADRVFGPRLDTARRYAGLLATAGVERGLIGPRELPRIWDRHVLNCAVVAELFPESARVVDVGSGAGLPGLVLAIRRPDLRVDLVESLQRRAVFLREAVDALGLGDQVRVVHGRAEEPAVGEEVGNSWWVTARAVAPLDRLMRWCSPLLREGGHLMALKGDQAEAEIAEYRSRMGTESPGIEIVTCGVGLIEPAVRVVAVQRQSPDSPAKSRRRR